MTDCEESLTPWFLNARQDTCTPSCGVRAVVAKLQRPFMVEPPLKLGCVPTRTRRGLTIEMVPQHPCQPPNGYVYPPSRQTGYMAKSDTVKPLTGPASARGCTNINELQFRSVHVHTHTYVHIHRAKDTGSGLTVNLALQGFLFFFFFCGWLLLSR